MTAQINELSRVRQEGRYWAVEILSPLGFWIVQGEHLTKQAADQDRKNWM